MAHPPVSSDRNARFVGRRIFLTGASSGIGRVTALLLAKEGATLALADIDKEGVNDVASATSGYSLPVDLSDGDAIDTTVIKAARLMDGIDGVVNCAGLSRNALLADLDPAVWDKVMAVNATAPYRIIRAALPFLRAASAATIVNVASGMALLPTTTGASVYAASKGALLSLTKALAFELAPDIRVNAVCPGIVNTPMVSHVLEGYGDVDKAPFVAQYALKRTANPAELAEAIAFLISHESSYITGANLAADGGRTFH